MIADALERELGPERQLAARLAAASMMAALRLIEETAAARMEQQDRALTDAEIAALLGNFPRSQRASSSAQSATPAQRWPSGPVTSHAANLLRMGATVS